MTQVTKRGRALATALGIASPDGLRACSLIARHAVTYARIQEGHCNGHPAMGDPRIPVQRAALLQQRFEDRLAKREATIERRITALCAEIDATPDFSGDPRGSTVVIVRPGARGTSFRVPDGVCADL